MQSEGTRANRLSRPRRANDTGNLDITDAIYLLGISSWGPRARRRPVPPRVPIPPPTAWAAEAAAGAPLAGPAWLVRTFGRSRRLGDGVPAWGQGNHHAPNPERNPPCASIPLPAPAAASASRSFSSPCSPAWASLSATRPLRRPSPETAPPACGLPSAPTRSRPSTAASRWTSRSPCTAGGPSGSLPS